MKNIYIKIRQLLKKHSILSFSLLTLLLMIGVYTIDQSSKWFQASILDIPSFNGTVMPIQKVPNWAQGNTNDKSYSRYSQNDLIDIMPYDINQLQSSSTDADTVNAQITYPVVYMGNYQLDHQEYAGSHLAVDIKMPIGTPVYSVANGKVIKVQFGSSGFGDNVCIQHADVPEYDTLYSCYAHLSTISVQEGDLVSKGEQIALSGNTGISTTPHLHFQIDNDKAPWHPWWPFTSTQTASLGLGFFDGINAGVGQAAAIENTINPLTWVQKHLSGTIVTNDDDSDDDNHASAPEIAELSISANPLEIKKGENVKLTVYLKDEQGAVIKSLDNDNNVQLSSDNHNLSFSPLDFHSGKATYNIQINDLGSSTFTVQQGSITDHIKVKVEADSTEANNFGITADDFVLVGDALILEVSALNEYGTTMSNFALGENLEIKVDEGASVRPTTLEASDFQDGVASVVLTSFEAGEYEVQVGNATFTAHVVADAEDVTGFEIDTPENFFLNEKQLISIYTIDENDNRTPKSFRGTVSFNLLDGTGSFSPITIDNNDFKDGKAQIYFTAKSNDRVRIQAKSGVLIGKSSRVSVAEEQEFFSDVSKNNQHYQAISSLQKENVIGGYSDGTFRPYNSVNRVEAVKILLLALEVPIVVGEIAFADTDNSQWYKDYLYTSVANEIVKGYSDGTFRPENNINRAEFFKVLLETANVKLNTATVNPFRDVSKNEWYATYAKYAKDNELLDFKNNQFQADKLMTRAEVAETLYRLLEII